jgi:hypothetical protein
MDGRAVSPHIELRGGFRERGVVRRSPDGLIEAKVSHIDTLEMPKLAILRKQKRAGWFGPCRHRLIMALRRAALTASWGASTWIKSTCRRPASNELSEFLTAERSHDVAGSSGLVADVCRD